jgi:hypothetical protein
MAISIEERWRLEAEDEAWERAHPFGPRRPTPPDLLDRIEEGLFRPIGTALKYVWWTVEVAVLAGLVAFFVLPFLLPFIMIALSLAAGAIPVREGLYHHIGYQRISVTHGSDLTSFYFVLILSQCPDGLKTSQTLCFDIRFGLKFKVGARSRPATDQKLIWLRAPSWSACTENAALYRLPAQLGGDRKTEGMRFEFSG